MKPLNQTRDDILDQDVKSLKKLNKTFPSPNSETRSQLSRNSGSKLPFCIKYLAIYDIIGKKTIIQMGNFSNSDIQIDIVRKDCQRIIDNTIKGEIAINKIQSHKSRRKDCVWITIVNDRKFLLTGMVISAKSYK